MNAAREIGMEVGSTRPQTRAERRAAAARVQAETEAPVPAESIQPPPTPATEQQAEISKPVETARPVRGEERTMPETPTAAPAVKLPTKKKPAKRPFATQLHPGTLARLDWIMRHGYVLTDTVDAAVNDYLDQAGIPRPDEHDRMPD